MIKPEEAKQLSLVDDLDSQLRKSIDETVNGTITDELVIAICGPLGSPINRVSDELRKLLENSYGYDVQTIKLSDIIVEKSRTKVIGLNEFERIEKLINEGNELRKTNESILADLAIAQVAKERKLRQEKIDRARIVKR